MTNNFYIYLLVMAGITYLVRMLPMVLIKNKIKNRFILSFLYYIPYTVLSVMTIPAIFYATSSVISALAGFLAALASAYFGKSLVKVAATSCGVVFVTEFIMNLL
ncbi:MAG: AzlD domain-containing protein [Clostridia bacterium]|nr:AzlD domain-containing protein [Clostridia bacterium]